MHSHCLLCTLCKLEFTVKQDWNDHLLTSSHQQLAKEECQSSWFSNESIRSSCVILFSSCPMSIEFGKDIIQCFGNKFVNRFVTDFVWWRKTPTCAVLQFESRFVAEKVLNENPNADVIISGKLVQIMSLSKILSLQWKQLIPSLNVPLESTTSPKSGFGRKQVEEFNWIRSCTQVRRENWESFKLQILKGVQKLFKCPGPFLFRNYPQQIQFHGSGCPLLFICAKENGRFTQTQQNNLSGTQLRKLITQSKLMKFVFPNSKPKQIQLVPGRCFQLRGDSHFHISFVTDFQHIREVQMARLLDYLCKFDSRLNGVLLLMAFWSKCHCIQLTNNVPLTTNRPANNPTILQWLVVLFLTIKGLIPSVKYIQDNLKSSAFFENTCENFAPAWVPDEFNEFEMTLLQDWHASRSQLKRDSEEWIESVASLTQQMFELYSKKIETGKCVLDTHNGIIFDVLRRGNGTKERVVVKHPLDRSGTLGFDNKRLIILGREMAKAGNRLQNWIDNKDEMELWKTLLGRGAGGITKDKVLDWQRSWNRIYELSYFCIGTN